MTTNTPESFSLGGNTGSSFSFGPQGAQPGASITGTILEMAEVQRTNYDTKKPEFWDNGDPKMQYRVTLQTSLRDPANQYDDGKRDLYLDGRRKANDNGTKSRLFAVLDAVRQATGGQNLARGGTLTVTWVSGMGFAGDPRNYTATYQPPAMDLGGQQQAPQVQAAPQAPPPSWSQPAQAQPPASVAQQTIPTEQGQVNAATGEIAQQVPGLPPGVQLTPELIAALQAANTPQG